MPRRDGTGPMGLGPASGRALGGCLRGSERLGAGFGGGRYCGRGFAYPVLSKENLAMEKQALEARLDAINKLLQ